MFSACILCAILLQTTLGGALKPSNPPIILSRSNQGLVSTYAFEFATETRIRSNARIVFNFPLEYPINLFEEECKSYMYSLSQATLLNCTLNSRMITLDLPSLDIGKHTILFKNINNPKSRTGTGYFKVETYQDATLIDSNGAFPGVGITDSPLDIQIELKTVGALVSSYNISLIFRSILEVSLPIGSWIRVSLPEDFSFLTNTQCLLNDNPLDCEKNPFEDNMIEIESLGYIIKGTLNLILSNIKNPTQTGKTGTFRFEILKGNSSEVLHTSSLLEGLNIKPGFIDKFLIQRSVQRLNIESDYYISFLTTSDIPYGGTLLINFPIEYQRITACEVQEGLEPRSSVLCSYDQNTIIYSGFHHFEAGFIKLKIRAKNPSHNCITSYFTISTYTSEGILIDQNLSAGQLEFSHIDPLTSLNLDMFKVKSYSAIGEYGPIEILLETRSQLPSTTGSTGGQIVLNLPASAQVYSPTSELECLFGKKRVHSYACTMTGQVITIQTPAKDFESNPIVLTINTLGDELNTRGFMLNSSGTGIQRITIEVLVYNGSGYELKEKADYYFIAAPRITSSKSDCIDINPGFLSFSLAHYSSYHLNSLDLQYTPSLDIKSGGGLRIQLPTLDKSFLRDLGLDMKSFEVSDYPCVETISLDLVSGCTIQAGTLSAPVVIEIFFKSPISSQTTLYITLPNMLSTDSIDISPSISVQNLDPDGFVIEQDTYTSSHIIKNSAIQCIQQGSIEASSSNIVQEYTDFLFTVPHSNSLKVGDVILIKFPQGFEWDESHTLTICKGSSVGMNSIHNYILYSRHQTHLIKFTATSIIHPQEHSYKICLRFINRMYAEQSMFEVIVIQSLRVKNCIHITTPPPIHATLDPKIEFRMPGLPERILGSYDLILISFTGIKKVKAGSIWIQLPAAHYSILGEDCYHLLQVPTGCKCRVDKTSSTHSYVLTDFDVSDHNVSFQVYMNVEILNSHSGHRDIIIRSIHEDTYITNKIVEQAIYIEGNTYYMQGFSEASQVSVLTPYIEARAGEYAPLVIRFSPNQDIPRRSSMNQNIFKITLPGNNLFGKPSESYIKCSIGEVPASYCSFEDNVVLLKQPYQIDLRSGLEYRLVISFRGANEKEIGFRWPDAPGIYRFKIEFGPLLFNATAFPTVVLRPARITQASVKSMSMTAGKPNTLNFQFSISTPLNILSNVYIWFSSSDWEDDLGIGVPNMSQVDCSVDYSINTAKFLSGGLKCVFMKPYKGYTKIRLGNIEECASGDVFAFSISGILNPKKSMVDVKLYISTEFEDISDLIHPKMHWLDFIELDYIDTTYIGSTKVKDESISLNQISPPIPAVPGSKVTITLLFNSGIFLSENDSILIKLPPDLNFSHMSCYINELSPTLTIYPILNYILLTLNSNQSLEPGSIRIILDSIILSPYVQPLIFITYIYQYRQLAYEITHTTSEDCFIPGLIIISAIEYDESTVIPGNRGIINISFSLSNDLIAGGFIIWEVFVNNTDSEHVDISYCQVIANDLPAGEFYCEIVKDFKSYLKVSGFESGLEAGTEVRISLGVVYPGAGEYDSIIKSHDGKGFVDEVSLNNEFKVSGNTTPLKLFEAPDTVFYKRAYPVRPSSQVGDLEIQNLVFTQILKAGLGQVKISFNYSISQVPNSIMRCIWTIIGEEYISPSCIINNYHIIVDIPEKTDIPANIPVDLLITSHIDGDTSGFSYDITGKVYTVTISADDDISDGKSFSMLLVRELEVLPQPIEAVVTPLHNAAGEYNILDITLHFRTIGCIVPNSDLGGRIVVVLPNIFEDDLGLDIDDAGLVPCSQIDINSNTATPLTCYLSLGDSNNDVKPKIHISGFVDYDSTASKLVRIEKVKNPSISGDDQIVDLTIYAENINTKVPGDKLCQSTLYNAMTINGSLPSSDNYIGISISEGYSNTVHQSNINYDIILKVPSYNSFSAIISQDELVLYLDPSILVYTIPSIFPSLGTIFYYSTSHILHITFSSNHTQDLSITLGSFKNPLYKLQLAFKYYLIRSGIIVSYGNICSATDMYDSVLNLDFVIYKETRDAFLRGEIASYILEFKPSMNIPAGGVIRIYIDARMIAQDNIVTNYYLSELKTGFEYNFISKLLIGRGLDYDIFDMYEIYGFSSDIPRDTKLMLKLNLKTPDIEGEYKVYVRCSYIYGADSEFERFENSINIDSMFANPKFSWHDANLSPDDMRAGSTGPVKIMINIPQIMKGSDTIKVTLPTFQGYHEEETFSCRWDEVEADKCIKISNTEYLIGLVHGNLNAGSHTLVLTTKHNPDSNKFGLIYPSNPGIITVIAEISISSEVYTMMREMIILPSDKFKSLKITSLNTKHNSPSLLKVDFTHPIGLKSYAFLEVCLPVVNEKYTRLFEDDLGYIVADGSQVPCAIYNTSIKVKCTLRRGYGYSYQPACIVAEFESNSDDNTTEYSLIISGFRNPELTPATYDILHITAKLLSHNGISYKVAQSYPYIYTIENEELTQSPNGTYSIITYGSFLKITIILPEICGADDVILIQGTYDFSYDDPSLTCSPVNCIYKDNSSKIILLSNLDQESCRIMTTSGLNILIPLSNIYSLPRDLILYWANKDAKNNNYTLYIKKYNQTGYLIDMDSNSINISADTEIGRLRSYYYFSFLPSVSIPTYGCITLNFTNSSVKPLGSNCYNSDTTYFSTQHGYSCTISDNILKMTSIDPVDSSNPKLAYNKLLADSYPISLRILFLNPTVDDTISTIISIYHDDKCSLILQSGVKSVSFAYSKIVSSELAYIPYQRSVEPNAGLSTTIDLSFDLIPLQNITAYNDTISIYLGYLEVIDLVPGCEIIFKIINRYSALCTYDSNIKTVKLLSPVNLVFESRYTISVFPREGSIKTSPSYNSTGIEITIESMTYKYSFIDKLRLVDTYFPYSEIKPFTRTGQVLNCYEILLTTSSVPINAKEDVLFVYFPYESNRGEILFGDDLGSNADSGNEMPCYIVSPSVEITCILSVGDLKNFVSSIVIIHFSSDIPPNTFLHFYLTGFNNTFLSGTFQHRIISTGIGHMKQYNHYIAYSYFPNLFYHSFEEYTYTAPTSSNVAPDGKFYGRDGALYLELDEIGKKDKQYTKVLMIEFSKYFEYDLSSIAAAEGWSLIPFPKSKLYFAINNKDYLEYPAKPFIIPGLPDGLLQSYVIKRIRKISNIRHSYADVRHVYYLLPKFTQSSKYGGRYCNDMIEFIFTEDYSYMKEGLRVLIYPQQGGFTFLDHSSLSFDGIKSGDRYPEWYYDVGGNRFVIDIKSLNKGLKIRYWAMNVYNLAGNKIKFEIAHIDDLNTPVEMFESSLVVEYGNLSLTCSINKFRSGSISILANYLNTSATITFRFKSHINAGTRSRLLIHNLSSFNKAPDTIFSCTVTKLDQTLNCQDRSISNNSLSLIISQQVILNDDITIVIMISDSTQSGFKDINDFNGYVLIEYQILSNNVYRTEVREIYRTPILPNSECSSSLEVMSSIFSSNIGPGLMLKYIKQGVDNEHLRIELNNSEFNSDLGTEFTDGMFIETYNTSGDNIICYIRRGRLNIYLEQPIYIDCHNISQSTSIFFPTIKAKSTTSTISYTLYQFSDTFTPICRKSLTTIHSLTFRSRLSTGALNIETDLCNELSTVPYFIESGKNLSYIYISGFLETPSSLYYSYDMLLTNANFPRRILIVDGSLQSDNKDGINNDSFVNFLNGGVARSINLNAIGFGSNELRLYVWNKNYTGCLLAQLTMSMSKYDNTGSSYYARDRSVMKLSFNISNFDFWQGYSIVVEFPVTIVKKLGCMICNYRDLLPYDENGITIYTESDASFYRLKIKNLGKLLTSPTINGIFIDWVESAASAFVNGKLYCDNASSESCLINTISLGLIEVTYFNKNSSNYLMLIPHDLSYSLQGYYPKQRPTYVYPGHPTARGNLAFIIDVPYFYDADEYIITIAFKSDIMLQSSCKEFTTLFFPLFDSYISKVSYNVNVITDSRPKRIEIQIKYIFSLLGLYYLELAPADGKGFKYLEENPIEYIELFALGLTYRDYSYNMEYGGRLNPFIPEPKIDKDIHVYSPNHEANKINHVNVKYRGDPMLREEYPAMVIEFPSIDYINRTLFDEDLGYPSVALYSEGLQDYGLKVVIESYKPFRRIEKLKYPTKMYLFPSSISNISTDLDIMLFNLKNPATLNVVDLVIYTQNFKTSSDNKYSNIQILKAAFNVINRSYPQIIENKDAPTGEGMNVPNFYFDSTRKLILRFDRMKLSLADNDMLILQFSTRFYDLSGITDGSRDIIADKYSGFIAVLKSSFLSDTIELYNFKNLNRKPMIDDDYFITGFLYQEGRYVKTLRFINSAPSTWSYSAITRNTNFGLKTGLRYINTENLYQFEFRSTVYIPLGGAIVINFHEEFILRECNAISEGFSSPSLARCDIGTAIQGQNKWIIRGFGSLSAGIDVIVNGYAQTPNNTSLRFEYKVETFYTSDISGNAYKMGELIDCDTNQDCNFIPNNLGGGNRNTFFIDWQYRIGTRMFSDLNLNMKIPIIFTIQPKYSLTKLSDHLIIDISNSTNKYLHTERCPIFCMFKDLSTLISYSASLCEIQTGPRWRIYKPKDNIIHSTNLYEVSLYTSGCEYFDGTEENYNGFRPFDRDDQVSKFHVEVINESNRSSSTVISKYVEPIDELKLLNLIVVAGEYNFIKIAFKESTTIPDSSKSFIVIEFTAVSEEGNEFEDDLGLGYKNNDIINCYTNLTRGSQSATCRLNHSYKLNSSNIKIPQILISDYDSFTDIEKFIWIPLMRNPRNTGVWVDISLKIYTIYSPPYLTMASSQRFLYKPIPQSHTPNIILHDSIATNLGPDTTINLTDVSFTLTLDNNSTLGETNYIIWKMPHKIIDSTIKIDSAYPIAIFDTIGYLISPGKPLGESTFKFNSWVNPAYSISTLSAESWHTFNSQIATIYRYNQGKEAYDPEPFDIIDSSNLVMRIITLSGGFYLNYYDKFYIEVKKDIDLIGGTFMIQLPDNFDEPSSRCIVGNLNEDVKPSLSTKAGCWYRNGAYTVSNIESIKSRVRLRIIFWGKITSEETKAWKCAYFRDYEMKEKIYESNYLVTAKERMGSGNIVTPARRTGYSPMKLGNTGDLYFNIKLRNLLHPKSGYITLEFDMNLIEENRSDYEALRCTWEGNSKIYSSYHCFYTNNIVTIYAPTHTEISPDIMWTITISSVFNSNDEAGLVFQNTGQVAGYHEVIITTYPDGINQTEKSSTNFFIPPNGKFTHINIKTASTSQNSVTNLKLSLKSDTSLETSAGSTEIVVEFNDGWEDIGEYITSKHPFLRVRGSESGYRYYIQNSNYYTSTQALVRGFDGIPKDTLIEFILFGLKNPDLRVIPNFKVYTRRWINGVYYYDVYMEVRYPYKISKLTPLNAVSQIIAYDDQTFDTTTTATFNVKTNANLDIGDILFFRYTSNSPSIGSIKLTSPSYTMTILEEYNIIMIELISPANTINSGSGVDFKFVSMPNPSYPISATWELHVISGGILTDINTYSDVTYTAGTLSTAIINYRDYYLSSHTPCAGLTYEIVVKITPGNSIDKIPKGGSVVINLVNFVNSPSECIVEHGLWPYECSVTGFQIKVTGFEEYAVDGTLPPIVVSFLYTVDATDATKTPAVNVEIYADASISASKIQGTFSNTNAVFSFGSASTYLPNTSIEPLLKQRRNAGLNAPSELILNLKTYSTSSKLSNYLKLLPPSGYSIPPNSYLLCWFANDLNKVPTFCYNDEDNNFIKVMIPVQKTLDYSYELKLIIRVRDSGYLDRDGIILPSASSILQYSNPYSNLPLFIGLYDYKDTLLEASKLLLTSYGEAFVLFKVKAAHNRVNSPNLLEIEFKASSDLRIGSYLLLEFPTYDGATKIWDKSLGLGMNKATKIDCSLYLYSNYDRGVRCELLPANSVSISSPVRVKVTGYDTITSGTVCILSLTKVYNPANIKYLYENEIIYSRVSVKMYAYSLDSNTGILIAQGEDFDVFKEGLDNKLPKETYLGSVHSEIQNTFMEFERGNGLVITLNEESHYATRENGLIIIELDQAFDLPKTQTDAIMCSGYGNVCKAISYPIANWIIVTSDGGNTNGSITLESGGITGNEFKSPNYSKVSYSVKIIVIAENVWEETSTGSLPKLNPAIPTVAIASLNNIVTLNTYALYTITITRDTTTDVLDKITVEFPSEYQWIDSECDDIKGLKSLSRLNPISCKSDCNNEDCTNTITVLNFYDENPSTDIVITIGAMTPSSTTVSDTFSVTLHGSIGDNVFILEQKLAISDPTTYTQVSYPLDVWLDWVVEDIYDRAVRAGQIGEIHVRFQPTYFQNGIARLHLPEGFDIALGGRPYCEIAQGDMPFDNYPTYSDRSYRHIPATSCTFSNRVITIPLPNETLREYYGLDPNKCTYFILTTTGASVNGFRAPWNPGYYDVKLQFLSDSNNIVEYSSGEIYIFGIDPPQLDINYDNSVTGSDSLKTIYSFNFITDRVIPKGYEYTYLGSIQPIATIEIEFDTFESFDVDLGNGYQSGSDVPCHVVNGLVAKTGESILCKFTAGDTSVFRPTPSKISITNFESIASGVQVEIHIPRITNPTTNNYKPRLGLGVYQIDSDQRVTWIYQMKYHILNKVDNLATPAVIANNIDATVTSSTVGTMNTLTLPFDTDSESLSVDDSIVIVFPEEWGTIQTGFTARILQSTNIVDSPTALTYTNSGVIRLTLSSALAQSTSYSIVLSNLRNPSYKIDCSDCGILYYSISSYIFKHIYTTKDISQSPISITAAGLRRSSVSFSSYSGEDVNVTILVTMEPEIIIKSGSEMTFNLATSIPNIYERPNRSCSVSPRYLKCAIVDRGVKITGFTGNAIEVTTLTIYGSKNPGTIPIDMSDFFVIVESYPNKRLLFSQIPHNILITEPKPPATLSYTISPEFKTSGLKSTYTFTLSSSTTILANSTINITFPPELSIPLNPDCSITGYLSSYKSCISLSSSLKLLIDNDIPANRILEIKINGIGSPNISSSQYEFKNFSVSVIYDDTNISASDPNDLSSSLTLYKSPEVLVVQDYSFYPTNRGEHATYDFNLIIPIEISNPNIAIILEFPAGFSNNLIPDGVKLICTSKPIFLYCEVNPSRRVVMYGADKSVRPGSTIQISLFGIANPSSINGDKLNVYVYNRYTQLVLAYSEAEVITVTSSGAMGLNLISVDFSSLNIHTKVDISFKFSIGDYELNEDKDIWVDWPADYAKAFYEDMYDCELTFQSLTESADCVWLSNTGKVRTLVNNINYIPSKTMDILLQFYNLPPPTSPGKLDYIILSIYDRNSKRILEKSFYNLSSYPAAEFNSQGYSISTPKLLTVRKGFYSDEFSVTLSSPSFDGVTVTPVSDVLTFIPENLTFRYAWNTSQTMRVIAPTSMKNGRYIVTWETSDSLYSPPLDLVVVVVDSTASLMISVDTIPSIPQGTTTPLIAIKLERAPIDALSVDFSFLDKTQEGFFKFNPSPIVFESGEAVKYFNITALEGASTTSVRVIYSGASSDKFKPQKDSIEIEVLPLSISPIYIRNAIVQKISPSSATIKFFTTGTGILYYVYALKGVPEPTYNQILSKNIIRNDVQALYGEECTQSNSKQAQVTLSNLEYNTEYVLYATPMSLSNIFSQDVEAITFKTTLPKTKTHFKIYTTSIVPKIVVIDAVASTLALPSSYFKLAGINPELYNGGRRLQSASEYVYELTLEIPDSLGLDPPVKLLRSLDLNLSTLKSYLPELDTTKSIGDTIAIASFEFPTFRRNPSVVNIYDESVIISASLNLDGLIGAVALTQGSPQPNSRQIMNGMDSTNTMVPSGNSATFEAKDLTASQLTLTSLTKGDTYDIWLSAKNSGTLVGELMDDDLIYRLTIEIPKEPEDKNTSTNLSWWNLSILCLILPLII